MLKDIFTRNVFPRELISDNGTQLVSGQMKLFLEDRGIEHHKVALYSPQQNGLVERFNRVLAEKLKEAKDGRVDMETAV